MKPSKRGMRAEVQLEGSRGSLSAVVWDDALRALKADGVEVGLGTVLGVLGRARTREFEHTRTVIDPETAEEVDETVTTRRQSVSLVKAWRVPVDDVDARTAQELQSAGGAAVVNLADYLHGGAKSRVLVRRPSRAGAGPASERKVTAVPAVELPRRKAAGGPDLRVVGDTGAETGAGADGGGTSASAPVPAAKVQPLFRKANLGTASTMWGGVVPVVVAGQNWTVSDLESKDLRDRYFAQGATPKVLRGGVDGEEPVVLRVRSDALVDAPVDDRAAEYALVVCLPDGVPAQLELMRDAAVAAAVDAIWEPCDGYSRWEQMVASMSAPAHTEAEAA